MSWWQTINQELAKTTQNIPISGICSPAIVPRTFINDDYYALMADVASDLVTATEGQKVKVYQTGIINPVDLALPKRAQKIASLITKSDASNVFLVFYCDIEPRRELSETESLKGAMKLINLLENAGFPVLVGFTSSDITLWKVAGATSCATGKFFNLRRFTKSRFEEPSGGGGQLPYWFEESIFAYCRESDVLRLRNAHMLSETSLRNPVADQILEYNDGDKALLALSLRH